MKYQFTIDGRPAGEVRNRWEDAAQDAVNAGCATWIGAEEVRINLSSGGAIARWSEPTAEPSPVDTVNEFDGPCPVCRCRTFAAVDDEFAPGRFQRCVECKTTLDLAIYKASEPSPVNVERVALLALLQHQRAKVPDTQQSRHSVKGLDAAIAALQSPPVEQPAQAEAQQPSDGLVEEIERRFGKGVEQRPLDWQTRDRILAALKARTSKPGEPLGLLDDGMCDDHGVFGCKKCLASLAASRTSPETEASEAVVEHLAAILEEWDMKQPFDPFTGHNYRDIARDILTRIVAHLYNTPGKEGSDG